MLYPSLHMVVGFMYYLFSSRRNCDCGCGQHCVPEIGYPNNGVRFCKDCSSDSESSVSECVSDGAITERGFGTCPDAKPGGDSGTSGDPKPGNGTGPSSTNAGKDSGPPPDPATNSSVEPPPTPRRDNKRKKIIVVTVVTVSITASFSTPLIIRAFFRPPMPNFALPDITVNSFDISTPNVIRANLRVKISSRNSNSFIRFYFDRLRVYVTYRDQPITFSISLPPNQEGHNETETWTANVCGTPVTLEPDNAVALCQEQATGSVRVTIRIVGRVRWKFWFFPIVKHKFSVTCSASIPLASQQTPIVERKCRVRL